MKPLLLLFIATLLCSCEYIENLTETSEIVSLEYTHETINYIVGNCSCNIEMITEPSDTLYIEGYEHVLEEMQITFSNDSLIIDHDSYIQQSELPTLKVYANDLQKISVFAPIELTTNDTISPDKLAIILYSDASLSDIDIAIDCTNFTLHTYGTGSIGNYYIEGNASNASYYIEGSIAVDAQSLTSENVTVTHKSIGDCQVNCESYLKVTTYCSGNTLYTGEPTIEESSIKTAYFSCTGEVIKAD